MAGQACSQYKAPHTATPTSELATVKATNNQCGLYVGSEIPGKNSEDHHVVFNRKTMQSTDYGGRTSIL